MHSKQLVSTYLTGTPSCTGRQHSRCCLVGEHRLYRFRRRLVFVIVDDPHIEVSTRKYFISGNANAKRRFSYTVMTLQLTRTQNDPGLEIVTR